MLSQFTWCGDPRFLGFIEFQIFSSAGILLFFRFKGNAAKLFVINFDSVLCLCNLPMGYSRIVTKLVQERCYLPVPEIAPPVFEESFEKLTDPMSIEWSA